MTDRGDFGPDTPDGDDPYSPEDDPALDPPACGICNRDVGDAYYMTGDIVACDDCRGLIERSQTGGSGADRFLRASVFGTLAAIGGFSIYFALLKTTGYQVGLISILVGLMVGKAVRRGARGRGGWPYQALAMFLVYSAVAASQSATFLPEFFARSAREAEAKAGEARRLAEKARAAPGGAAAAPAPQADPDAVPAPKDFKGFLGLLVKLLLLGLLLVYAVPILLGIDSPMGLVIVAFAMWEAWKLNRRRPIVFAGPFAVEEADEPPAAEAYGYA